MKFSKSFFLFCFFFALFSCINELSTPINTPQKALTSYVDPFIGTANFGHVIPGATVPFGMIQLCPDNGMAGWDNYSIYNWANSIR